MIFKRWVKSIQVAGYNGVRTLNKETFCNLVNGSCIVHFILNVLGASLIKLLCWLYISRPIEQNTTFCLIKCHQNYCFQMLLQQQVG